MFNCRNNGKVLISQFEPYPLSLREEIPTAIQMAPEKNKERLDKKTATTSRHGVNTQPVAYERESNKTGECGEWLENTKQFTFSCFEKRLTLCAMSFI